MKQILLVVLAWITVACSGESVAPRDTSVAGEWRYSVEQLSNGGAVSCSMLSDDTLLLGRSTSHVVGRYMGGTIQCLGADVEKIELNSGSVINGTIDLINQDTQNVTFDLGGSSWHQTGSLKGDRMSGQLTVDHVFAGQIGHTLMVGTWTARRIIGDTTKPHPL